MYDIEVIEDPRTAAVALAPLRHRLLTELVEPGSAAALAQRTGIARQKLTYHLKALEAHGLVTLAGERKHGGITERLLQATAASYVVSPAALDSEAANPDRAADRLSARYLIGLAGRLICEIGQLSQRAERAGKRLPLMAIDTEIGFASSSDRAAFADELTSVVLQLAARYHHDDGRRYRLVVATHPKAAAAEPTATTNPQETE